MTIEHRQQGRQRRAPIGGRLARFLTERGRPRLFDQPPGGSILDLRQRLPQRSFAERASLDRRWRRSIDVGKLDRLALVVGLVPIAQRLDALLGVAVVVDSDPAVGRAEKQGRERRRQPRVNEVRPSTFS